MGRWNDGLADYWVRQLRPILPFVLTRVHLVIHVAVLWTRWFGWSGGLLGGGPLVVVDVTIGVR